MSSRGPRTRPTRTTGLFFAACAAMSLAGCKRPVDGRNLGATLISDLRVTPANVRDGVPIELSFRVTGAPPVKVFFDIGGKPREQCTPERTSDGRYHCVHPGVDRAGYIEGPTLVVLGTEDDEGRSSILSHSVNIDFECPRFVALSVVPAIAEPGDTAVVSIEASETLAEPPIVTQGGRPWETAIGAGQSYAVTHNVTIADPQTKLPIVVRLRDLAGNTSGDCNIDGALSFSVDQAAPAVDISKISLLRDAPGLPSVFEASEGAFLDDVAIAEVRVWDEARSTLLGRLVPGPNGAIPPTSLGVQPRSRVLVEAIDGFERRSPLSAISERWILSIGSGATTNAALRTDSRFSPAPPRTRSMKNRTAEGAPAILRADARVLTERTRIAFEKVGDLPSRYEDVGLIITGYEPVKKTVLAIGGHYGTNFNLFASYMSDVLYITWDEEQGRYIYEQAPPLTRSRRALEDQIAAGVPSPRYGRNMAFDGRGCGVLFGGVVYYSATDDRPTITAQGDTWQLCAGANGYEWTRIPLPDELDSRSIARLAPIIWDPLNERYVIAGGNDDSPVLFLEPDPDPNNWAFVEVLPLPSAFTARDEALLYWDEQIDGFAHGLGYGTIGSGEHRHLWTYRLGQWTLAEVPIELGFRAYFGSSYDHARKQLVLWGGTSDFPGDPADPTLWLMTRSSTVGPSAWRGTVLDHPVPRDWPALVYDSDREVTLVMGGVRNSDARIVPPEIHQIVTQPSSPHLQATIDLDAPRPRGIDRLELMVRGAGTGDADSVDPGAAAGGGIRVLLYDFAAKDWVEVGTTASAPGEMGELYVSVAQSPERFVGEDGTVPVTVTTRWPATEALSARLDVDVIQGSLILRSGVVLD